MLKREKKLFFCFVLLMSYFGLQAQESINASGGDASGSGGSASYSVGQVVYTTNTGTNGSVAQGVQQPYEISVVTELQEAHNIQLTMTVYPNPSTDLLILNLGEVQPDNMFYILYDITGKTLLQQEINQQETHINVGLYPSGIYLLSIHNNSKEIKTFKIIKN